jgi:hypothetical protein
MEIENKIKETLIDKIGNFLNSINTNITTGWEFDKVILENDGISNGSIKLTFYIKNFDYSIYVIENQYEELSYVKSYDEFTRNKNIDDYIELTYSNLLSNIIEQIMLNNRKEEDFDCSKMELYH